MPYKIYVPLTLSGAFNTTRDFEFPIVPMETMRELVKFGLQILDPIEHLMLLRKRPAWPNTHRRILTIALDPSDANIWYRTAIDVQRLSNRRQRDRLGVSVLATAIEARYGVDKTLLIDSGFLSMYALDIVVSSADVNSNSSPATNELLGGSPLLMAEGFSMPAFDSEKSKDLVVQAKALTEEQTRAKFDVTGSPKAAGRILTHAEREAKLQNIQNILNRSRTALGL